jgi:hypothetical protein
MRAPLVACNHMKRSVLPVFLLGIAVVAACGSSGRPDDFGTGDGGNGSGSGSGSGSGDDGCSAASKLVYVVDQDNKLSQFDPTSKTFSDLGTLNCPAGAATPFSMGVDRNATAYVLYVDQTGGTASDAQLFKVDTTSASLTCTKTTFSSTSLQEFGMGFSTTTAGGDTDQLFIAGGTDISTTANSKLNTLDVSTFTPTLVHQITGSPELTGNANAELWGFFPDTDNPKIAQIDKTTGATTDHALTDAASFKGQPLAWAFAFYGGDYWIFLEKDPASDTFGVDPETNTTVYQVSDTGVLKGKTNAPGRVIVGAGVSTCAPVVIE